MSLVERHIDEGRRHLAAGAFGKAEAAFRKAVEVAPGSAVAHNELGVALFQRSAAAASIPEFRKALKLDPQLAHAWANLGEAQRMSKRYKRAALSFHKFLQITRGDRYGVYGLALSFEGYESFDKALRTLAVAEKAARNDPRLLARVNRAIQRVRLKMAEAKLSFLDRGDARLAAGRWQEALDLYEKGLRAKKGDPVYLGRRGIVKAILGDFSGGRADLRAALLAAPKDEVARNAFVLLLDFESTPAPKPETGTDHGDKMLAADRAALAWHAFARTIASGADASAQRLQRGEAGLRLGLLDAAEEDFSSAPDDPSAALGRAEVHWIRGAEADAKAEAADLPVSLKDLPVWRRSLLSD